VLGRGLDQYPPETLTGELRNHPGRHEHYRVDSDRGGREGSRARHQIRWGVSDVTGGDPVDVRDLADAAPLEQCRGQPRLLVQAGFTTGNRSRGQRWVKLPKDTRDARFQQILEAVKGQREDLTPNPLHQESSP